MNMAYKILYIDDQDPDSRKADFEKLGFIVDTLKPTNNFKEIEDKVRDNISALILDYKLSDSSEATASFDAPTIAQFVRTIHSKHDLDIPIVLMSNQVIYTRFYENDLTSQDLFDFTITKQDFNINQELFAYKLNSFILAYLKIKEDKNFATSLGLEDDEKLPRRLLTSLGKVNGNIYKVSKLIYEDLISSIGLTIGKEVLLARLGILKESKDADIVLGSLDQAKYTGVFSDIKDRWWMEKVNQWWKDNISSDVSIRRLNANERVELIKDKMGLDNLIVAAKTKFSNSSNFWTICKYSKEPIDPFDGVEILKDYLPWQEKEYLSIDAALEKMDDYKDYISSIDKKAIRELSNTQSNG
jgi:hypothetical protein